MKKSFLNSQTIFLAVIVLVIVYFVFIRPSKFGADELSSTTDLIVPTGLSNVLVPIKDNEGNSLGSAIIPFVNATVVGGTQTVSFTKIESSNSNGTVTNKITYTVNNGNASTAPIGTNPVALPTFDSTNRTTFCTSAVDRAKLGYPTDKAYADAQCLNAGYVDAIDKPLTCNTTGGTGGINYKCTALTIIVNNPYTLASISSITYQLYKSSGELMGTSTSIPVGTPSTEIPNFIKGGYIKITVTPKTAAGVAGTAVAYNYGAGYSGSSPPSFTGNVLTASGAAVTSGTGAPNTLNNNADVQNNTITLPSAKITVTSTSTGIKLG